MPSTLEIEHIIPKAKGGSDSDDNLWLACRSCNMYKSDRIDAIDPETQQSVLLFNPAQQTWSEHFNWSEAGLKISGRTPIGRATVIALQLNNIYAVTVRRHWIAAGWHPPIRLTIILYSQAHYGTTRHVKRAYRGHKNDLMLLSGISLDDAATGQHFHVLGKTSDRKLAPGVFGRNANPVPQPHTVLTSQHATSIWQENATRRWVC